MLSWTNKLSKRERSSRKSQISAKRHARLLEMMLLMALLSLEEVTTLLVSLKRLLENPDNLRRLWKRLMTSVSYKIS
jgi:hypothetical protein